MTVINLPFNNFPEAPQQDKVEEHFNCFLPIKPKQYCLRMTGNIPILTQSDLPNEIAFTLKDVSLIWIPNIVFLFPESHQPNNLTNNRRDTKRLSPTPRTNSFAIDGGRDIKKDNEKCKWEKQTKTFD